jgi:NhaP-type Na+/H+ or K+/H+ antiporter
VRAICFLFLVVFAAVIGVLVYLNSHSIAVSLPFTTRTPEVSFPLLVGGAYLLGMFSGWSVVGMLKRSWQRVTEADRR